MSLPFEITDEMALAAEQAWAVHDPWVREDDKGWMWCCYCGDESGYTDQATAKRGQILHEWRAILTAAMEARGTP